jgi:hypothetical protein
MKLTPFIQNIRAHCPFFCGRVGGAISTEPLMDAANLVVPSAYVVLEDDEPDRQYSGQAYRQDIGESISVVVCISNEQDQRGQKAADDLHGIRKQLFVALLGWSFDDEYTPLEYMGSELVFQDRSRVFYAFKFSASYNVTIADTRQWADVYGNTDAKIEGMPDYEGVNMKIDFVDPVVDTNRPKQDFPNDPRAYEGGGHGKPDGRIEHQGFIPQQQT